MITVGFRKKRNEVVSNAQFCRRFFRTVGAPAAPPVKNGALLIEGLEVR